MQKPLPAMKLPNRYRFDNIHGALAIAAKSVGIKPLAAALDKSPGTLRGELVVTKSSCNPMKLGFDDAISIMFLSGDLMPLHLIADLFDCVVVSRDADKASGPIEQRYLRLAGKAGYLVQAIAEVLEDNRVTNEEKEKIEPLLKDFERLLATEALK